jgi:hypothetical protein
VSKDWVLEWYGHSAWDDQADPLRICSAGVAGAHPLTSLESPTSFSMRPTECSIRVSRMISDGSSHTALIVQVAGRQSCVSTVIITLESCAADPASLLDCYNHHESSFWHSHPPDPPTVTPPVSPQTAGCSTRHHEFTLISVSATWPESVRRLASTFLSDPVKITVGSDELSANKRIEQVVEVLDNGRDKE